jgi:predicted peptidase
MPAGQVWDVPTLDALLDDAVSRFAVDPRRIYLTGLSMGGYSPGRGPPPVGERFAAIAPSAAESEPIPSGSPKAGMEALARLPIWAFHGAKDPVVPLAGNATHGGRLPAAGQSGSIDRLPRGRDSWTATCSNPEFYDWLLQHQRP